MFYSSEMVNREVRDGETATMVLKDVFELSIVTNDYLSHHEERMVQQWQLKYESLGKYLEGMMKGEIHPEHLSLLESITSDYESLGEIFSLLRANFVERTRLIEENKPQAEIDLSLDSENRLSTQALMSSQRMASAAFNYSAMMQQRISQVQQRTNSIALVSIIGFVVLSFFISFFTTRAITEPLNKLVKSAEIIGKGNLKHRVDIKTRNEIGELAVAFNKMTEKRQQAEEALGEYSKRLENMVEERTAELEAANKELEAFSYTISHDLRAPLRAMDGFSLILIEEHAPSLSEEAQRYLQVIRDNAHQMGDLIDDLLAFSRLSRQSLKKLTVAPADLARQALEDLHVEQEGREVEITIDKLPTCQADPVLLKQVFANLLGNALKFTREREKAVIEVGCREDGDKPGDHIYFVKDNGVGFDMQYMDKLFSVFERLHRAEEYEGTGVGLAIVQRIIHRHGGHVWAEAGVNKGATFNFTLKGGTANG